MVFPGRLLTVAYGLSAAAGCALILAGAGVAAAIAAFWLGGAAVALGLAATPWFHRPESAQRVADPDEVARALRAWEEERLGAGGADVELRRISGGAPTR